MKAILSVFVLAAGIPLLAGIFVAVAVLFVGAFAMVLGRRVVGAFRPLWTS